MQKLFGGGGPLIEVETQGARRNAVKKWSLKAQTVLQQRTPAVMRPARLEPYRLR